MCAAVVAQRKGNGNERKANLNWMSEKATSFFWLLEHFGLFLGSFF